MKVTYNWLKDFVEIKISPEVLAEKLTMAGLEVTSLSCVSLEGKPGKDFVFEIEVTANRPDCLSVVGIAREVAAITNKKLKLPKFLSHQVTPSTTLKAGESPLRLRSGQGSHQLISIKIEDKKDCPLYTAKIIKNVLVGPSPEWLKTRLELVGCRSINNIVDITNYIMFAWGQPLHAFDLEKLGTSSIIVRRAKNNEKLNTIDGETRLLTPEILVIADSQKPVAVAGIMGGEDTEVTQDTQDVLLEAAVFNPIVVRHGRKKLGIQSESAYRFERGVDLETTEIASWLATRLIQGICSGVCVLNKSSGRLKREKKRIKLNVAIVDKILGSRLTPSCIAGILKHLDFKVRLRARSNFIVEVPSHRPDINLEIDLIEEIARIFGYENIPKTLPAVLPQIGAFDTRDKIALIKNILVGLGLNEVITYSLIDSELLKDFGLDDPNAIEILNPLSKEQEVLRSTIIPSLCRCIAHNLNQKQSYINIFEIVKAFSASAQPMPKEEFVLGIAICGKKSWLIEQGLIRDPVGFLHLKGILEVLFERLGISEYSFNNSNNGHEIAVYVKKEKVGVISKIKPDILDRLDIKNTDVFALELFLERLFCYLNLRKKFKTLPLYPAISRDISLVLKEGVAVEVLLKTIAEHAKPLLKDAKVLDYYRGKQIPHGFKGLTISCTYRSDECTLTEEEINPVHSKVSSVLQDKFGAKIR